MCGRNSKLCEGIDIGVIDPSIIILKKQQVSIIDVFIGGLIKSALNSVSSGEKKDVNGG